MNSFKKNLYRTILNCKLEVPLVVNRLKESFGLSIRDIENTFLRPRKCTLNSKLREFQFKMLHGIIYTNLDLYRFGLVSSDLCSFCKKEVETYRHLFYDCEHIRPLWNACGDALNLPTLKELNWEGIFFGAPLGDISKTYLLNHVILLLKYVIFQTKKKSIPPNSQEVKEILVGNRVEEKRIALNRNTLSLHLKKRRLLISNE